MMLSLCITVKKLHGEAVANKGNVMAEEPFSADKPSRRPQTVKVKGAFSLHWQKRNFLEKSDFLIRPR